MIFKIINGKAVRYDSAGGITKIDDISVDFSQAESRDNISSSDNVRTILGKIMKWFSDLSAGAASSLLGQNLTANKVLVSDENGKVTASAVDASKVPFLSGVTGDVQEQINSLNSTLEEIGSGNSDGSRFKKVFMNQAEYTDANSLPVYTFAYVFSTATNIPSGAANGSYIITIGVNNGERMQIYLPRAIGIMGVRYIISGSWTVWKNITLT